MYLFPATCMTIHEVWIGSQIYWTISSSQLPVRVTVQGSEIFTIHCAPNLLNLLYPQQSSVDGFQQQTFPFLWVPEPSPCLSHSNSADTNISRQIFFTNTQLNPQLPLSCFQHVAIGREKTQFFNVESSFLHSDRSENTASNSCSGFASVAVPANIWTRP